MIDINPKNTGLAQELSNQTHRAFLFDGVQCTSIASVLCAFNIQDVEIQRIVCTLQPHSAEQTIAHLTPNGTYRELQYWKGTSYRRTGQEYRLLLDKLYLAAARGNIRYRQAIFLTGCQGITCTKSEKNPYFTTLTADEFCQRMVALRELIITEQLMVRERLTAD